MIKIDGEVANISNFPDGSMSIKYAPTGCQRDTGVSITWKYENDREFMYLIYLVKHLRSRDIEHIYLHMPYIPNARMDRVKNPEDVFTLKYFADLLNDLHFDYITVLDPHSSVSEALINNLCIESPKKYIEYALGHIPIKAYYVEDPMDFIGSPKLVYSGMIFYPDEGAMKRYSDMFSIPYAFGVKKRNWKTGKIESLDVIGAVDSIAGKDILIVDDICSKGGTFLRSAKKLKELGAKKIYLYVSHCENTFLEGELLTSGLIEKVYTTDSIFTKEHEKIEVIKI